MKYEIQIASYYVNPETLLEKIMYFFLGRYVAFAITHFDSREVSVFAHGKTREESELNAEKQIRGFLLKMKIKRKNPLLSKEEIKSIDFNI